MGEWLREVAGLMDRRLIVVGGTGLYLGALTRGLAPVPPVPPRIRAQADALLARQGGLQQMLDGLDPLTRSRIDIRNPARVQRAWEVLRASNRGLAQWQAETPPPLIGPDQCQRIVLNADRDWLAERIARRFDAMLREGALDEVRRMLPQWDARQQWAQAIGAPELTAHLRGQIDRINDRIYHNINNGVYRCGFATTQEAYETAYAALFDALDEVESLLGKQRYLVGDQLTEADWRLFTTLVRFDAVYFGHFKTNRNRIADFAHLSNYLRELYQYPGIADTVNFSHIKGHYYYSHDTINPTRVVPVGPRLNLEQPHNRALLATGDVS